MDYVRKPEPVVLEIQFNLPPGPSYLDINQVTSLINRKFIRQGMQVPVQSLEVQFKPNPGQTSAVGDVLIEKLPTTWIMANSWVKGFKAFERMNREALEENESVRPKFLDYKIYADAEHHQRGFALNIMPTSIPNKGEWESSKVFIPEAWNVEQPDGTNTVSTYEVIATGANYPGAGASGRDAVSLIEGYAASRSLPDIQDPNTPDDASSINTAQPANWIAAIFNDGITRDADIIDELITENNIAPYPFENGEIEGFPGTYWTDTMYPNGANQTPGLQFHDNLLITTSTIGGSDTAIGGIFPCGLAKFTTTIENGTATLILRLIPGEHRGYMMEPMQEMNS